MDTKEKIKYLFQTNTNESTYKKELIRLVIIVLIFALLTFTNIFSGITQTWMRLVILLPIVSTIIFLILFSLGRLLNIADNVERIKKKSGNKKYKYPSITVRTDQFIRFLKAFELIIDFDIILDHQIYIIGISMDYDNKKGVFFDKKFTIDDVEYDYLDPILRLFEANGLLEQDTTITIQAVDSMNPKHFLTEIKKY